jgi:hypothetical protein
MSRTNGGGPVADVIYRAVSDRGQEVVIRLRIPPAEATVPDAWRRLTAVDAAVDPRSLEIEVRGYPARIPDLFLTETEAALTSVRGR